MSRTMKFILGILTIILGVGAILIFAANIHVPVIITLIIGNVLIITGFSMLAEARRKK